MKKLLLFLMMLAFALPAAIAGEKTIVINRNEGIYEDGTGVYYCSKGGITMTFSSGLNNVNYLVEHQQVVFDIFSTNYVIKKIKFNCLDNTTDDNLDCFYWGPSTISELGAVATYVPTGTYTWSGYIGTWVGGSTPSKYIKFVTEGKPVRFGSVEITIDKEFGDIYDLVTQSSEIQNGQTYALVSKDDSRALGKEEYHGSDSYTTFSSTPVTLLNFDETQNNYMKVKVTDEVALMKLQSSGNSDRPWYIKIGDNYMRRRTGTLSGSGGPANGQGYNLYTESSVPSGREQYFRTNISIGNNSNALIRFQMFSSETPLGNETFAIRHYNGGDLFRVIDYNTSNNQYANNQRVYLYKPAQTYYITTNCLPDDNSGYITLGDGVLNDGNGNYTSQQYDNVNFFVGPTEGWGIGAVTVTNLTTNEVTTLTPTATSDFGNDYQFPMPGANVSVTANFLQPFNIDTICNPSDGGQFNFINGYTNFSGQYYSNEGKTVTFKPTAAEGYIFNSVTYTDNVTGETTTLTPDADGVYSFVMPGNDVTLTANFEAAHDLYLLGTANGRTSWIPSGPKFTFDGQKYYIDVYFKGGNDDPNTDPAYGYFSLTKKIDEGGNWNNIQGYRLAAENNNTWVEDGYTGVQLYNDRPNNAFKIPPGVYRIEVNAEMTEMSIIEYPLTVTFDPASGTVVDAGDVVSFTSNLNDLVHGINSQEVQATYNSYDNWGVTTSDDTHTITHDGITTVTGQSKIGYITATGTADYEIVGDLYLLGTANGMDSWQPYGPKFTYDATTETYSLDVYFTGLNVTAADAGYGYFSLSSVISDPNNPNWSDIPNSARYNAEYNDEPITGLNYNESVTEELYQTDPNWCFKIDPGVYTITVKKDKSEMTVTKHELTLSFNPPSGTTVAAGDPVNIYSNLEQVVHAINPDEPLHATIEYATSTDGSLPTPDTAGSTVNITAVGATTTVNALAALGYIVVSGNAYYTVPAPEVYDIFTIVDPEEAGTITAPSGDIAGATVNFTVTDADPSLFTLMGVEVVDGDNAIVESFQPSADGNYSFTMPDDEVTIYADYVRTPYNVTTSWSPSEGGAIWLNGVNTPQTVSVPNADQVVFGVAPADGYMLTSFTVTNTATGQEITPTPTGISNEYTFTMPAGNVIIMANFLVKYNIITQCTPPEGGSIDNVVSSAAAGETVTFTVTPNIGWTLTGLTVTDASGGDVTVTDNGNGSYSFTMPEANVTVTANYGLTGVIFKIVTDPSEIVEGEYYTIISRRYDRVLNSIAPNATPNYYSSTDIVGWVTPGEYDYVKLDGRACFFSPEDVTGFYINGHSLHKVGYLKTSGGYIGREPNVENNEYGHLALFGSKDDVKPFAMSVDTYGSGSLDHYAYIYYDHEVDGSFPDEWQVFFDNYSYFEYNSFLLAHQKNYTYNTWLYKPAKMYNITTVVTPGGTDSSLELLGGVIDNTGAEGSAIIVVPVAGEGYALSSLVVTNDGTGEVVEATPNIDGSYSFIMPGNDVTITAHFETGFKIETECEPEDGGEIIVVPSAIAGRTVTFEVWPNDDYVVTSVTVTTDGTETLAVDVVENEDGAYSFVMPASDVIVKVVFDVQASTLQYIEKWDTYESGTRVTVSDELIGTWMAKQYLWAKDQYPQRSNVYLERDVNVNPSDFLRNHLKREVDENYFIPWQPDEWDQSNWVMLDFSQIPGFENWEENDESYLAMREAMQTFVDNKIEAGTITGRYLCQGEPMSSGYEGSYPKVQHIIVLEKLPEVVKPVTTPETTLGYPGYVRDPKEWRGTFYDDPSDYSYNHYMSYNFKRNNTSASGTHINEDALVYWHEHDIELEPEARYFFMNPKDQEVAQVCGVWVGQQEFNFNGEMIHGDVFDSYAFSPEEGVNQFGFSGAFYVPSWDFNRLISEDEHNNPRYGKPSRENGGELEINNAYIFHAAIQYTHDDVDEPVKAPRRDLKPYGVDRVPPEYYIVYPLDLMKPSDSFTAVREIRAQESVEIDSIRFYNVMGQESETPFDGINIEVIRYKDGSMISRKVLR